MFNIAIFCILIMEQSTSKRILSPIGGMIMVLFICLGFVHLQSAEFRTPHISNFTSTQIDPWPNPDSVISGIPVYHSFDRLEGIFGFRNDTTYVINFWATWCKPCIEELPLFESLNSTRSDEKIKVVLISLDFPDQVDNRLIPFIKKHDLKSSVLLLLDGNFNSWIDKISPEWSGAIPATYIYKKEKNQLYMSKYNDLQELENSIKPFL